VLVCYLESKLCDHVTLTRFHYLSPSWFIFMSLCVMCMMSYIDLSTRLSLPEWSEQYEQCIFKLNVVVIIERQMS